MTPQGHRCYSMNTKVPLNTKACEVAQPSIPPTSVCKGSIPSCTAHTALSRAPDTDVLPKTVQGGHAVIHQIPATTPWTSKHKPVAVFCVSVCITVSGAPNKGDYGEICVVQKKKHDYGLTDSVLPSSWFLLPDK